MNTIKTVGVIGAGQMGAGIAQVAATAGYKTLLCDANEKALEKGVANIHRRLDRSVEKEVLTTQEANTAKSNLESTNTIDGFSNSDIVIEAIIENFDIKAQVFSELAEKTPAHCILASNTSSISITKIAAATPRPELVVGAHFMNPVPIMELVELIRGLQTSDETYEKTKSFSESLGKTTVLAVDGAGFIVNRILCPMINEAIFLVQEGCTPEDIDNAMMLGTNHPMGPLTLADFVGLDTLLYILEILHRELGDDKYRPCPLLRRYIEAGWYGKKSGRGFYKYEG
jgi:3-hydroxybutyryl-CoA dehydrogenase